MTFSDTRLRSDGRREVADTEQANELYGCTQEDWCILTNGHHGECWEDREVWAGLGEQTR
jgi:hypothetical protein